MGRKESAMFTASRMERVVQNTADEAGLNIRRIFIKGLRPESHLPKNIKRRVRIGTIFEYNAQWSFEYVENYCSDVLSCLRRATNPADLKKLLVSDPREGLRAAKHAATFLRNNYQVTFVRTGTQPTPDLSLTKGGIKIAVEISKLDAPSPIAKASEKSTQAFLQRREMPAQKSYKIVHRWRGRLASNEVYSDPVRIERKILGKLRQIKKDTPHIFLIECNTLFIYGAPGYAQLRNWFLGQFEGLPSCAMVFSTGHTVQRFTREKGFSSRPVANAFNKEVYWICPTPAYAACVGTAATKILVHSKSLVLPRNQAQ